MLMHSGFFTVCAWSRGVGESSAGRSSVRPTFVGGGGWGVGWGIELDPNQKELPGSSKNRIKMIAELTNCRTNIRTK